MSVVASHAPAVDSFTSSVSGTEKLISRGQFNISLDFATGTGAGTVVLQRKLPGEAAYHTVTDAEGDAASWTGDLNTSWFEPEVSAYYKFVCTFTSGTIASRIGQ